MDENTKALEARKPAPGHPASKWGRLRWDVNLSIMPSCEAGEVICHTEQPGLEGLIRGRAAVNQELRADHFFWEMWKGWALLMGAKKFRRKKRKARRKE